MRKRKSCAPQCCWTLRSKIWAYMENLRGEILLFVLIWLLFWFSLYCHGLFWMTAVTDFYDFLSSQMVIWGADVGDLHVRGLPVPRHSCWRTLQVAKRGTSHGQAWQLHQWAVRIFTRFDQKFREFPIRDSLSSASMLSCPCAAATGCTRQTVAQMCSESWRWRRAQYAVC